MPSMFAPTFYERSKRLESSRYDTFWKCLNPDQAVAETGSVETPLGHVSLIELTDEIIGEIVNEYLVPVGAAGSDRVPESGWYITRRDDNGLIWAMFYGPLDNTLVEEAVRADFAEADAVDAAYAVWVDDDEPDDDGPEKMYLVCNKCGEAFDTIEIAATHGSTDPCDPDWGWLIKPESEAM